MKQRPSFHNSVVPPPPPVSTTTLMQDSKDSRPATTTTFATEAKLPIHQKYNNNGFGGSSMNGITSSTSKGEVVGLFDSKSTIGIGIFVAVTLLFSLNLKEMPMLVFCTILCTSGFVLADRITRFIETQPKGTTEMQSVVDAVRQGAEGFFKTQYGTIFRMTGIVSVIIFVSYLYRPLNDAQAHISPVVLASITTLCFVFGAMCSTLAGYAGLYICVRANGRVAGCARRSFKDAMQIALLSGAVPALLVIGLVVIGIVFLYALLTNFVVGQEQSQKNPAEVPLLLVGYGFGASFVALFAQLGGGIYTKAADVGADLVGKGEFDLDEDDPRNPAVVADLVGDNVGTYF
jgi:H+-translocating diphosphatase